MRFKFLALGVVAVAGFAVAASKLYVDLPVPTAPEVRVQITSVGPSATGLVFRGVTSSVAFGRAMAFKGPTGTTYTFAAGNQTINGAAGMPAVGDICNGTPSAASSTTPTSPSINPSATGTTVPQPTNSTGSTNKSVAKLTCVR